jgi:hypothetical protein
LLNVFGGVLLFVGLEEGAVSLFGLDAVGYGPLVAAAVAGAGLGILVSGGPAEKR